jgi:hypothetical protein
VYPDYDHGSFQRMYIELKEEAEGDFTFLKADNPAQQNAFAHNN